MSDPVLSICIPTYNRSKYLFRLLDSLVHEISDNSLPVNIKITNNASTDDTESVCDEFLDKYKFISVIHQSENYGADFNIATAFSLSNGNYTWVIGDDDYVRQGAITAIINLITTNSYPDLIYLRSESTTEKIPGRVTEPLLFDVYHDPYLFSKTVGVMFTFISAMVIKRNAKFNHEPVLYKYDKSCLIQLSWVLSPLVENGSFVKANDVFVIAEPDNTGGYKMFEVFSRNLKFLCDSILGSKSKVTNVILTSSSKFLLNFVHKDTKSNFIKDLDFRMLDDAFANISAYRLCYRFLYRSSALWHFCKKIKGVVRNVISSGYLRFFRKV